MSIPANHHIEFRGGQMSDIAGIWSPLYREACCTATKYGASLRCLYQFRYESDSEVTAAICLVLHRLRAPVSAIAELVGLTAPKVAQAILRASELMRESPSFREMAQEIYDAAKREIRG